MTDAQSPHAPMAPLDALDARVIGHQPSAHFRGHAPLAAELEHPEVLAHDRHRDVVDGHLADAPLEAAGVRVAVQDEVGVVLEDRDGQAVGPEEAPDLTALALEG